MQKAMTINNPVSVCSHDVMCSSLRTHNVMAGYIKHHHFKNHPTNAAEYVKFLVTNLRHDKVDKLEVKVKGMQEESVGSRIKHQGGWRKGGYGKQVGVMLSRCQLRHWQSVWPHLKRSADKGGCSWESQLGGSLMIVENFLYCFLMPTMIRIKRLIQQYLHHILRLSYSPLLQSRLLKLVKPGHIAVAPRLVCGLSFGSLPAWLWSFRSSNWAAMLLTDTDERRLCQ